MRNTLEQSPPRLSAPDAARRLLAVAQAVERQDLEMNARLSRYGAKLLGPHARVLTYCNTGGLATAGVGTALGVLQEAHTQGKRIHVIACETRPVLQGLRLTTWELARAHIPYTLITDNMAGLLMAKGLIHAVVVGADRIARNGDVANKIGTYSLAILAKAHRIPFYVAAPWSTVDPAIPSGRTIRIEQRDAAELLQYYQPQFRPNQVKAVNPAFDITPAQLLTAIVTDRGIHRPPFRFPSSREGARRGGQSLL